MATKIIFTDETTPENLVSDELTLYANKDDRLFISMYNPNDDYINCCITLDKQDALKLIEVIKSELEFLK
jgi:anaerobic ribonucleoside-triphosphate reductase